MQIGLSLIILASLEFSYGLKCFSCTYNVDSDGKVKEIDGSKKCSKEWDNHTSIDCPDGQVCSIKMGWENELRFAIRGCKEKSTDAEDTVEERCDLGCVINCVCGTENCNRRHAVYSTQPQCIPPGFVYDYYEENDLPRPSTKSKKKRKGKKNAKKHGKKSGGGSTFLIDIWTTLSSFIFAVYFYIR